MKPLIGITVDFEPAADERTGGMLKLNWNYAECIARAGGVPILIPPQADAAAMAQVIHGLLVPGGRDIDASNWGEENHPKAKTVELKRFNLEVALWKHLPEALPVLGVCYGCQFINVMRGGSLIQHLPDVVGHSEDQGGTMQEYTLERSSSLATTVGESVSGKSYHHQAIGNLGAGLKVVGKNSDGTVEAIEATDDRWLIGVQWHPERTSDDLASQKLFEAFVNAAAEFQVGRP